MLMVMLSKPASSTTELLTKTVTCEEVAQVEVWHVETLRPLLAEGTLLTAPASRLPDKVPSARMLQHHQPEEDLVPQARVHH